MISPSSGSSNPEIQRSRVVLPHPEGPSSEKHSPSRIVRLKSRTAMTRPWLFVSKYLLTCLKTTLLIRHRPFLSRVMYRNVRSPIRMIRMATADRAADWMTLPSALIA